MSEDMNIQELDGGNVDLVRMATTIPHNFHPVTQRVSIGVFDNKYWYKVADLKSYESLVVRAHGSQLARNVLIRLGLIRGSNNSRVYPGAVMQSPNMPIHRIGIVPAEGPAQKRARTSEDRWVHARAYHMAIGMYHASHNVYPDLKSDLQYPHELLSTLPKCRVYLKSYPDRTWLCLEDCIRMSVDACKCGTRSKALSSLKNSLAIWAKETGAGGEDRPAEIQYHITEYTHVTRLEYILNQVREIRSKNIIQVRLFVNADTGYVTVAIGEAAIAQIEQQLLEESMSKVLCQIANQSVSEEQQPDVPTTNADAGRCSGRARRM